MKFSWDIHELADDFRDFILRRIVDIQKVSVSKIMFNVWDDHEFLFDLFFLAFVHESICQQSGMSGYGGAWSGCAER